MKTIEEKSIELFHRFVSRGENVEWITFKRVFCEGAEFAQRWIPIDEELPLPYEKVDWDGLRSDYVIAKDSSGEWHKAQIYQGVIDGIEFVDWYSNTGWQLINIVSWRPIEYK